MEHLGMVILYHLFFQFVIHLSGGWIVVQTFMCVLMRAHVLGVGTAILKFTSGKTVPLKSVGIN
jgi:hypothetical protein